MQRGGLRFRLHLVAFVIGFQVVAFEMIGISRLRASRCMAASVTPNICHVTTWFETHSRHLFAHACSNTHPARCFDMDFRKMCRLFLGATAQQRISATWALFHFILEIFHRRAAALEKGVSRGEVEHCAAQNLHLLERDERYQRVRTYAGYLGAEAFVQTQWA
jgi:hypothetical protein